jgi:hypothetical protein
MSNCDLGARHFFAAGLQGACIPARYLKTDAPFHGTQGTAQQSA